MIIMDKLIINYHISDLIPVPKMVEDEICKYCGLRLSSKNWLRRHYKVVHKKTKTQIEKILPEYS